VIPHLTIIYGGLSRYDLAQKPPRMFSGAAGDLFQQRTFDVPELKPGCLDIRLTGTPDMQRPFYSKTRFLLLGVEALKWLMPDEPNLMKHRGFVLTGPNNCPAIATFHPIECYDFKATDFIEDDDDEEGDEAKDVGPTSRLNYLFWALLDYRKLISLPWPLPGYRADSPLIAPNANFVVGWLNSIQPNAYVTIDIETRRQDHSLDCVGLRSAGSTVVVPFYSYTGGLHYGHVDTARIYRALYQLFLRRDVTIVGHNLSFDLSVLCWRYQLPLPRKLYDTLLAQHREYPQLEKSLSHALSLYTYATRNHKGDIALNVSYANFQRLLGYNANDVLWTARIMEEQHRRHATDEPLARAVATANRILYCTLLMSFTGIAIDVGRRDEQVSVEQSRADALTKVLRVLTENPTFNPASPNQCAALLYTKLMYPIDERTKTGAPSTGVKTLYKLQLKQPNPIIPFIIHAREAAKAASMLRFRLKRHK